MAELDLSVFGVHTVDYRKAFDSYAFFTKLLSAVLEALFDNDADSFELGSGLLDQVLKSVHGTAVCKEIIDDENFVTFI